MLSIFVSAIQPTKWKTIASFLFTIMWILFLVDLSSLSITDCLCLQDGFSGCRDYYSYMIIKSDCHCRCTPFTVVLSQYFFLIFFPFGVVYLLVSFITLMTKIRVKVRD